MIIENLLTIFSGYICLVTFLGTFFGGDSVILFLSALAGQGIASVWKIFLFAFFGTFCSDIIWFLVSKTKYFKKITKCKAINKGYKKIIKALNRFFHDKSLTILIVAKFLYGTRILTIFYLGTKKINLKKFIKYNSIATIVWLCVLVPIGWFAGRGLSNIISITQNIQKGISLLIAFIVIIYFIRIWIDKKLSEKIKNGKKS